MNITDLVDVAGTDSEVNGFHDKDDTTFGDRIALVHSELSEALEEYRAGHGPELVYCKGPMGGTSPYPSTDRMSTNEEGTPRKPEGVPSELADVVIRIADMAWLYGIDLEGAIKQKLEYNRTRGYRHGGKRI